MKTLEEIKAELETLKPTLKKRFKVETIDIFGSYARKQATEKSGIDQFFSSWGLGLKFNPPTNQN